ncbi:SUMO-specific isopeptidase USPL1 [Chanos chanos]|uniref:SUMO-specific isopeptidase USPL1 n=1 Tax=Chanos chanos TaxID=29144 RepID=A0A6J2WXA6_CHACN|nr:SUMO-specific isopeptidase USPL1 [Chanos chanos]
MVMLTEWQRAAAESRILSDTPMSGEGTGIGVRTPTQAGYLGKSLDTSALNENCPWCAARGQTYPLHSYAISFRESITLCSNSQCIFPLVSRPLDEIRASLSLGRDVEQHKKRKALDLFETEDVTPSTKRCRGDVEHPSEASRKPRGADLIGRGALVDLRLDDESAKRHGTSPERGPSVNGAQKTVPGESFGNGEASQLSAEAEEERSASVGAETAVEPPAAEETGQLPDDLAPVPSELFWKNDNSLCWLDAMLVALVQCHSIKEVPPQTQRDSTTSDDLPVWNLCSRYDRIRMGVRAKEQVCGDGVVRVPSEVLRDAERELLELRASVFRLLQPKLRCSLGEEETPVFALPLFLRMDNWAQDLFQHSVEWQFQCTSCGHSLNSSCEMTITTFTQIVSNWHPLNAVHRTQCSICHRKNQRRKMVLKRVSRVLGLHFVEGLPRRDVSTYSFNFREKHYVVKMIIQYNQQRKHFITWVQQPDGSWLEFDDLKHPHCITHKKLTIPASQMHVVFWEGKARNDGAHTAESPEKEDRLEVTDMDEGQRDQPHCNPDNSTLILDALGLNEDNTATAGVGDASIGCSTLLDTFEGLSHSDIITLTLEEVKVDTDGTPVESSQGSTANAPAAIGPEGSSVLGNGSRNAGPPSPTIFRGRSSFKTREKTTVQTDDGIVLPSVVMPPVAAESTPANAAGCNTATSTSNSPCLQNFLLNRHPSILNTFRPPNVSTPRPRCSLKKEDNEALPAKPAQLFGGFKAKNDVSEPVKTNHLSRHQSSQLRSGGVDSPFLKPRVSPQKPPVPTTLPAGTTELLKKSSKKVQDLTSTHQQPLNDVQALRLKLMKKLKAKKKKLAKLNQILGKEGEPLPKPDSTELCSPYTVSSTTSACSSPTYDQFFADLLSPATTASNLSPDSTGLLELIASSQSGHVAQGSLPENHVPLDSGPVNPVAPGPHLNVPSSNNEDFLEQFMSGSDFQQTSVESTDLSALDLFFDH